MAERFPVCSFATAIAQLQTAVALLDFSIPERDELINAAINDANKILQDLKLSPVLRSQWERLLERSKVATRLEIAVLIREMNNNLLTELSSAWFLIIPSDRRFVYQQPSPIFGQGVHEAFPEARKDIAAAGRCYALDEWTACVLHLMRALEYALRWLANRVGLTGPEIDGENWKNVIDQIEKKIRSIEQEPKTPEKIEKTQLLSEAALQFRWFKDAWRNYAIHGHEHYDERDGQLIFLHIVDFFRHIAAHVQ